ncbi:hypothetical protein MTO96_007507 [Rhipicephalus appendiculatus]
MPSEMAYIASASEHREEPGAAASVSDTPRGVSRQRAATEARARIHGGSRLRYGDSLGLVDSHVRYPKPNVPRASVLEGESRLPSREIDRIYTIRCGGNAIWENSSSRVKHEGVAGEHGVGERISKTPVQLLRS